MQNVGSADKVVRLVLAAVLAGLVATSQVEGVLAIVAGVLAAVLVLTSLISVCPLYMPFGLSTRKKAE